MSERRYYFVAPREVAERAYAILHHALEDEAYVLAIGEQEQEALLEVSVYAPAENGDLAARLKELLGLADAELTVEELPDRDWVALSLEGLRPVRAGRFVVHGAHDRASVQPGEIGIEIEAGQAFGTGHHGTTAGCLQMLDRILHKERPRSALDLGTGSAVLAIAVAKRVGTPVLATDIDAVAVRIARQNVRLNGVQRLVNIVEADGVNHPAIAARAPFDLITANILAGPLIELAPAMAHHAGPGGTVILSGILERQREAVLAAYTRESFEHLHTIDCEGWTTLLLRNSQ
jgi:ribosomal protein L11 methyltransferase